MESPCHPDTAPDWTLLLTLLLPLLPADELWSLGQHLLHAATPDDRLNRGALSPEGLAQPNIVLQPQFDGVYLQPLGQDVHHRFNSKIDLRVPEALHRTGRDLVGVNGQPFIIEIGEPVKGNPPSRH